MKSDRGISAVRSIIRAEIHGDLSVATLPECNCLLLVRSITFPVAKSVLLSQIDNPVTPSIHRRSL